MPSDVVILLSTVSHMPTNGLRKISLEMNLPSRTLEKRRATITVIVYMYTIQIYMGNEMYSFTNVPSRNQIFDRHLPDSKLSFDCPHCPRALIGAEQDSTR